jgi:Leucine-rich repeat (LRR) protein
MGQRTLTDLIALLAFLGFWVAGQGSRAWETPEPMDRQQFRAELTRLTEICIRLNLKNEADICQTWLAFDRPDLHRLYLPSEFPRETGKKDVDSWRSHFINARKRYAEHLFSQAKILAASDESAAYRLLWQVMRENPEHAEAKRTLGPLVTALTARPTQRPGLKVPELSASALLPRWQSRNFQLASRATAKESLAMISQLERFHALWTQYFYELWATAGVLANRIDGGNNAWPDTERMEVMLLANRKEYLQLLGVAEDNIGASVGYYNPIRKLSIFYQTDELAETMFHELTHQLFSEASAMKMAPVLEKVAGAWCIEGVALYMESLTQAREGWTVGGMDARRLQTARYRALRDEHWALWEPFCQGTLQDWKSSKDIALSYSHATGLTHLFLDNLIPHAKSKSAYFSYIRSVYEGNQSPGALFDLLGGTEQSAQLAYRKSLTVTDRHLQLLSSTTETVKQLVLSRSNLEDWAQLDKFKNLQWLDVSYTNVANDKVDWLLSLKDLQRLSVEGTKLDGSAMPQITKLRKLTELDLSMCNIDDAGLAWLVSHPNLETLYLTGTKVTEKSLATLSTLPKLKSCDVSATVITKDVWEAFVEKNLQRKK